MKSFVRKLALITDPARWVVEVESKTTHTLWLVIIDFDAEPELEGLAMSLRAQPYGFVNSSGRMPELRINEDLDSALQRDNGNAEGIEIGSTELGPGTWQLDVPEAPPGTRYAVSYARVTLDDLALL